MSTIAYLKIDLPVEISTQLNQIQRYGFDYLFVEESWTMDNPELGKVLTKLNKNDVLLIYSLVTVCKNNELFEVVKNKNVRLVSLDEKVDTEKKEYTELINNFNLIKTTEKKLRSLKMQNIIQERKKEGKMVGRPTITADKKEEIVSLYQQKLSLREIATIAGTSLGTVHKYVHMDV
ncbi:recombinase family protein [Vagococcus salmoninarum]|uniref:recombinase family protein n=1 Tax=Vagococcus salmoninarum TaxID=2739 RepID=UPI00187EA238|nr:recombinase family protein [Vagococcus salmoninarum]MBE9388986.1 recombinase family protein [Vagococcus salmoninarum]